MKVIKDLKYAVIAAAGFGSRLDKGIPKCLVEVNGHRIIEYQLALLKDIPHVRMIVGYQAEKVMEIVKALRSDVEFVLNEKYAETNTLQSYYLGCKDLNDFFILIDGDLIFNKESFKSFINAEPLESTVGIAEATTEDAVFVHLNEQGCIEKFTRTQKAKYEWSNLAILHSDLLAYEATYVYQRLEHFLPLNARVIERLEIDTPADMEYACRIINENKKYQID